MSESKESKRNLDEVGQRDAFIIQKTQEGWPCRKIAEHLEVSGARVNQIQKEYGVETTKKEPSPKYTNQDIASNLKAYYEENGHAPTVNEWDGKPSANTITNRFGGWKQALIAAGIANEWGYVKKNEKNREYDKEELIKKIKEANKEFDYPSFEKVNESERYPAGTTYVNYFGSYSNALREAGIDPCPASGGPQKMYEEEEMLEEMLEAVKEEGGLITIEEWDAKYAPPSSQTYRNKFGNWTAVCNIVLSKLSQGGVR